MTNPDIDPGAQPLVRLQGVDKAYADGSGLQTVLQDFSLSVPPARSVALVGPSGSGKSTLLNIIAGIVEVDQGQVELLLDGQIHAWHSFDARKKNRVRRQHMGYVHQFFNLIPTLTVIENVMLPLQLNRCTQERERATQLLDTCGLLHRQHAFPEQLSGGEQQRTAVARAIAHEPKLILADEPTGNLDEANSNQVAQLLFACCEQLQASLVVATHSLRVAELAHTSITITRPSAT